MQKFRCETAVVERAHWAICDRLYKHFTHKNTYRYKDVLPKFVKAYIDTVTSISGMAPSRVTHTYFHAICRMIEAKRRREPDATGTFRVGQHVRICKEKMKFAKAAENNFSTEIFWIFKVIDRLPRALYKLVDLEGTPIDGQFDEEELTPVRIISRTTYKIGKYWTVVIRGIRVYLVRWRI